MLFEEFDEELYKKAVEEDAKNAEKIDVIRSALAMGMDISTIAQLVRLPKHAVEKIINSLK